MHHDESECIMSIYSYYIYIRPIQANTSLNSTDYLMTVKFLIVYSSAYLSTDHHIGPLQADVNTDPLSFLTCFICYHFSSHFFPFFKLYWLRVFDQVEVRQGGARVNAPDQRSSFNRIPRRDAG